MHHTVTPPLQEVGQQPDCDSARVIRQPASGGLPVSCLWHVDTCHLLCFGPRRRLPCTTLRLLPCRNLDNNRIVTLPESFGNLQVGRDL